MFNSMSHLWSTPIAEYSYNNFNADKPLIIESVRANEAMQTKNVESEIATLIKSNLKESKFQFLEKNRDEFLVLRRLQNFFFECISDYVYRNRPPAGDISMDIHESWYHITNNNGYHGVHSHGECSLAGIFYVQSQECGFIDYGDNVQGMNGINVFHHPNPATSVFGDYVSTEIYGDPSHFRADPREGNLILFPSYILHEATPYNGNEDRIVISFNSKVHSSPRPTSIVQNVTI